jgi:uncharacterized membrane protein YfcA
MDVDVPEGCRLSAGAKDEGRDPPTGRPTRAMARLRTPAIVGVLAGFLSGLFGVGGGILIVPGLVLPMRMSQRLAHGTSLAAIVPIAVSGVIGYTVADSVDWPAALLVTLGAICGALLGTRVLHMTRQEMLRRVFAAFLLLTAARLLVDVPEAIGRDEITMTIALALVTLGLVSGTLAGLLGVGGGIVIVPALVLLFGVPDAVAKGTSLLVIIPTAVAGTLSNLRKSNADLPVAAVVGLFGVVSALAASQLSVNLDPTVSSVLFALLLVGFAAHMLLRGGSARAAEAGPEP